MRDFILKSIFLLLPVLVIVLFCEFNHRYANNNYKYKYRWLSHHAPSIQILSLGSSHGLYGIDPTQFDLNTFNAAHVSQDLQFDEFIFDSFFDRMDSLEYVILPISYFSPWFRLEDGEEHWRIKNYHIYYHYPINRFKLQYSLEIYSGLRLRTALYEFLGRTDNLSITELGQGTEYKKKNRSEEWKTFGITAAKRHTRAKLDTDKYQENLFHVQNIIEKCRTKQVGVLLVIPPAYFTYRENLNDKQLSRTKAFCESLQNEFTNVIYLDLLSDVRFEEDDFYDPDHLNEYGAAKLSCILNQVITNLSKSN